MGNVLDVLWSFMVDYSKGWGVRRHAHNCFQMYYCISGEGAMRLENQEILLHQNDLLIIRPNQHHELHPVASGRFITIDTKFQINDEAMEAALAHAPQVTSMPDPRFYDLQQTMRDEWAANATYGREMAAALLEVSLLLLLRGNAPVSTQPPFYQQLQKQTERLSGLGKKIADYLTDHFLQNLSLDQIAQDLRYSKNYLCRTFKQASGYTIDEYVNRLRINKAYGMVCYTNQDFTTISRLCGFSSIHYFSRMFHKIVGISPTQSRNQRQNFLHTDIQTHGTFQYRYFCRNIDDAGQEENS